jgi:mono/diheme cytochrome c family protein
MKMNHRVTSLICLATLLVAACGGGGGAGSTGSVENSGPAKTSLRVEASDADGDALKYQWRATAGTIENRQSRETVWTMPDGPGLHFAYVVISDGKGGYVEQQYAVSTDALGTAAPTFPPVSYSAPAIADFSGTPVRLRFEAPGDDMFQAPGAVPAPRKVYLPDVQVQVISAGAVVFSGVSDLSGEVSLPKLEAARTYEIKCATRQGEVLHTCRTLTPGSIARVASVSPMLPESRNLRVYGHVGLADGGVCGVQNDFLRVQSSATVQLQQADGSALGPSVRVNRFGDYALDAAVPVNARLKLRMQCESYAATLDVPAPASAATGYVASAPVEVSHQIPNRRPQVVKVVANGQDGNVRGQMLQLEFPGDESRLFPDPDHFLTYKGKDTPLSACMYYRSFGAVGGCDAQGNMAAAITFEDWKRKHQFKPYAGGNAEVAANFINRRDLNLVRRMFATSTSSDSIAFYVCNHPGPVGGTQTEVDQVIDAGLKDDKRVACVAMEWTSLPGVNGGVPFTKFLTFAPDGALLPSINLDGRGEKFMPGSCVACHGGTQYNGRFPEKGNPSPFLGARFLPFDTANYSFGSSPALTEQGQVDALYSLNQLVRATERTSAAAPPDTPTTRLVDGWYAHGKTLDKNFVPPAWRVDETQAATAGASRFYLEVIGTSCRTCHTALGPGFDWDALSPPVMKLRAETHVCGGSPELALNASMPNALVTRNDLAARVRTDPSLAALMRKFFGCDAPRPDPVYPKR